jgi:predicted metal-dependent hydrolase
MINLALSQIISCYERPLFKYPDRKSFWEAVQALWEINSLYEAPGLKHIFKRQIEAYEKEIRRLAEYLYSRVHFLAVSGWGVNA